MEHVGEMGFRAESLPDEAAREMLRHSWRPGCPAPLGDLRLLTIARVCFDGRVRPGELVVHKDLALEVLDIFRELLASAYPVFRMRRVDAYGGDDIRSCRDNNSSAFNCRTMTGSDEISLHALGRAIDLNPLQNPYVSGETILPPEGAAYLDRSRPHKALILRDGPCCQAFLSRGWTWGGDWEDLKDYHHFEKE